MADSTRLPAALPYFLPPDFFRAAMTKFSSGKGWEAEAN
jgi:hypothetical protein